MRIGAANPPIAADRRGVAAVEFAFIAPVLLAVLWIVIELGLMLTAKGLLDSAALRASRLGSTGFAPAGMSREQYIREFVAEQAYGLLRPEQLAVSAKSYDSFGDIGVPGEGASGFGGPGSVVVYTLTYPWTGATPLIGKLVGAVGMKLTANLAVRNEAFDQAHN